VSVASTHYQPRRPVGDLLREWRQRRRISQLDLAIEADISARHLSFVETGRSRPTSAMILRLTEHLDVPLRDRNTLLLAGGFAPAYPEHPLDGPELARVRGALRNVLSGHEPYPALGRQLAATGDARLAELYAELQGYPAASRKSRGPPMSSCRCGTASGTPRARGRTTRTAAPGSTFPA
jgi:transcriptional regulator with XRE-family HTH domain